METEEGSSDPNLNEENLDEKNQDSDQGSTSRTSSVVVEQSSTDQITPQEDVKKVVSSSSSSSAPSTASSPPVEVKKKDKINILLKPVGDAPILKQKLWAVDPDKQVASILLFIKSYLRLEPDQNLFFFVNQAFAPSPDQLIRNLYECFGSDGKLILNYSTTTAWG